jgi:hypothetical protein
MTQEHYSVSHCRQEPTDVKILAELYLLKASGDANYAVRKPADLKEEALMQRKSLPFDLLSSPALGQVVRSTYLPMTDILDDAYESDLTDEEHKRLILMSEHAIAKPISPAAQAVLDAAMQYEINPECYSREIAATALRAAALHLHAEEVETCGGASYALVIEVDDLIAIADELEAQ